MTNKLVIVESPAKAKTIKKYLGKDFEVLASYGHVRDLIPKGGAIDTDDNFTMHYAIIEKNAKHVAEISKALKKADALYLATDLDREGEAISWHLCELMHEKNLLKDKPVYRVVFHEITKTTIKKAIENPREISMNLVDAQQARRALDYLVGFNLSPLLWRKIRTGLSAGRVQSPALRMIVERELEIEAFNSKEYWTINAEAKKDVHQFTAKLTIYKNEKLKQFTITNEKQANSIKKDLLNIASGKLKVSKVEKKQRKRNPTPPFITSTMQQEAARKLGFSAQRTMRIAQQLYEGISIGAEPAGLITYMRTDSTNLAEEAITEIRSLIEDRYGKESLPDTPRVYKTKSKNAQEAHEAIRPTSAKNTPENLKEYLSIDQLKLYSLIWRRTVASQMVSALIDTVSIDLECNSSSNIFHTTGSTIASPGFITVYQEGNDDQKSTDNDERRLPKFTEGEIVNLEQIICGQHFTEPPPRFSEASLIKALEEYGIGRPSTYASIIATLQNRGYTILETKRFKPTDVGRIVNKFLTTYFAKYVDYNFTAALEDQLDAISRGEDNHLAILERFWQPFKDLVAEIDKTVERKDVTQEKIDENCPKCGEQLTIRLGRSGRFIGCSNYPECKYTRNLDEDASETTEPQVVEGRLCPDCNSPLHIKRGRYGKFIGCSNYPNCKHMEPLEKPADTGIKCPECKKGSILKRKSRYGKIFYSCSEYPKCKYAIWNEPVDEKCPKCGWPILAIKVTKRRGTEKVCPQKECKYSEQIAEPEDN